MNIKKHLFSLALLFIALATFAQTPADWEKLNIGETFFQVNDMGRNGYYKQKPFAELLGKMGEALGPDCILAVGDIHHFWGVASVNDPLWMTNYELIYSHPELMIPWYPAYGNHEYRGNTQAVLDYAKVSRRWMMPARYYTKVLGDSIDGSVRLIILDTSPLINRYREESAKYPDACKQDREAELAWLAETLKNAHEDWIIVAGHHPIYADTPKTENERLDMQQFVLPILKKSRKVDIYTCGHIHNFQHIRMRGDNCDYIVNSSPALSRKKVNAVKGTVFKSGAEGFTIFSWNKKELRAYMIDETGTPIHTITRTK